MATQSIPVKRMTAADVYLTLGKEKTFEYEGELPPLPVPPLKQTLERYLYWAQPHLTQEEYAKTVEVVKRFESGIGKELHKKLVAKAATSKNWLENWWLQYAYLTVRDPILPMMNTTGPLPLNLTLWKPSFEHALERSAMYFYGILHFYKALREQRLRPQSSKEGQRFCMNQFRYIFNCTRIPGQNVDSLYHTWKTADEGECPNHAIVLCHGHIWTLCPWDENGNPHTAPELQIQLKHIRQVSDNLGVGPCVSVLTCDKRDKWAENRDWLKSISIENAKALDLIETSMFVFVLDDSSPEDFQQIVWEGLCGDTLNRWADKSMSAIITRNGCGTVNNDHTPNDAMATVVLCHYQVLLIEETDGKWLGTREVRDFPLPTMVHFDLDSRMLLAIEDAKKTSSEYIKNTSVRYYTFMDYGKDFMKVHKLHPDAYVQMVLQLAYYRLHKKFAPTYETATTRQFHHGRTETMKSCTPEVVEWVKKMFDPKASVAEKRHKLMNAINTHRALMKVCENNEGVDRHLFGLYVTALDSGLDIPEIFTEPAFTKSGGGGNYVISSSTTGYTPLVGGVAAMVENGYGCFYNMQTDKINFFISSFLSLSETNGDKFCEALRTSLLDMRDILSVPSSNL